MVPRRIGLFEEEELTNSARKISCFLRRDKAIIPVLCGLISAVLVLASCSSPEKTSGIQCRLLELRPNPQSRYFDAVIRIEEVTVSSPFCDRFEVATPSLSLNLADLLFEDEGQEPALLEKGDIFTVPLNRTDWKVALGEGEILYCIGNFWDQLPPEERWHPARSEAMTVAQGLELVDDLGLPKPVLPDLPPDWQLIDEMIPTPEDPTGFAAYQKKRGDLVLEQIEIQYAFLTEADMADLEDLPLEKFLARWSDCAQEYGRLVTIAGRPALECDMEGHGEFGWTYRYWSTLDDMVIAIDIQSDPLEWVKTDEEKELERKTDRLFLRFGYGPFGEEEWQAMIELRFDRTGSFHKRSRTGEVVEKAFELSDREFGEIESVLKENAFFDLESRSGGSGGLESFLTVNLGGTSHTVEMKNYRLVPFENIAGHLRRTILPKVNENES